MFTCDTGTPFTVTNTDFTLENPARLETVPVVLSTATVTPLSITPGVVPVPPLTPTME